MFALPEEKTTHHLALALMANMLMPTTTVPVVITNVPLVLITMNVLFVLETELNNQPVFAQKELMKTELPNAQVVMTNAPLVLPLLVIVLLALLIENNLHQNAQFSHLTLIP